MPRISRPVALTVLCFATVLACLLVDWALRTSGPTDDSASRAIGTDMQSFPRPRPVEPRLRSTTLVGQSINVPSSAVETSELRVLDQGELPIGDAEVMVFSATDELLSRESTSRDGLCAVKLVDTAVIAVRHPQYARISTPATALRRVGQRVEVVLPPGGIVSGFVRMPDGGIPNVPVRVVAWPVDAPRFGMEQSCRAVIEDPRLLTAVTTAAGDFVIFGVPINSKVTVIAAGPGIAQVGDPTVVTAGAPPQTIVVAPLFVMDIQLIDEATGRPIRAMPTLDLGGGNSSSFVIRNDAMACFPSSYSTLLWTGIDVPSSLHDKGSDRTFMAFAVTSDGERYGPFTFRAAAPGYEPHVVQVWALRAHPGADLLQRIVLRKVCSGFGTIRVSMTGASDELMALIADMELHAESSALLLSLWHSASQPPYLVDLRSIGRGPVEIENVPTGTYRAKVSISLGSRALCEREYSLSVTDEGTVSVALKFDECPVVELLPKQESGEEYTGALQVVARRVPGNAGSAWKFDGPPYAIVGVEPGIYEVRAVGSVQSHWNPMVIESGKKTWAQIVLSPRHR